MRVRDRRKSGERSYGWWMDVTTLPARFYDAMVDCQASLSSVLGGRSRLRILKGR